METSLDVEELNSPDNKEFVSYLGREIDDFLKTNGNSSTIMLFPPFNSYKRLLTHHLVEFNYSNCGLTTFSIGEEPRRRTVVCLGSLRKNVLDDDANESKVQKSRSRAKPSLIESSSITPSIGKISVECGNDGRTSHKNPTVERQRKVRKTISYYIPPHLRKTSESEPAMKKEKKEVGSEVANKFEEPKEVETNDNSSLSNINDNGKATQSSKTISNNAKAGNDPVSGEDLTGGNQLWDPLFCGKGNCSYPNVVIPILDKNEMNDITKEVGNVKVVEIKGPVSDISSEGNDYVNGSIIEIYDLPGDIKTDDLARMFEEYINRGFRLRWVDESHALGIFSSSKTAEEALSAEFARFKIRPIAQGTPLSQEIARNVVLPSSFRPKTCSSLAKRLLSGALGLKVSPLSPEERAAQRERMKECKDQRKKTPV